MGLLPRSWRDGVLSLHVSADVLASAAYPLTIDPIVHHGAVHRASAEMVSVDLFRDDQETVRNLWVAFAFRASADDIDLVVVRADETQPALGSVTVFSDITTAWSALEGRLAGVGGVGRVVAGFTRAFPLGTPLPSLRRAVRWHAHDKADLGLSTAVGSVSTTPDQHDWAPSVGGSNAFAAGRFAVMVFQRERGTSFFDTADSDVLAVRLDLTAPGQGASLLVPVAATAGRDEQRPTVNPEALGGSAVQWLLGWEERDGAGDDFDVVVRGLDSEAALSAATLGTAEANDSTTDKRDPRLAGQGGRYLLAYRQVDRSGPFDRVRAQRIDWAVRAGSGARVHASASVEGSNTADLEIGGLTYDNNTDNHWAVTVLRTRGNRHDADLAVFRLGFRGRTLEREFLYAPGNPLELLRRGAPVVYDDDNERYRMLFVQHDGVADVVRAATLTQAAVVPERPYGASCATTPVDWLGTQRIGSEAESLRVRPPLGTTNVVLVLSLTPADLDLSPFGMPGCRLLVNLAPGQFIASLPLPAPNSIALLPLSLLEDYPAFTLHAQAFHLGGGGLVASRGMQVQLVR
jgi:hypothetical protein